MSSEIAPTRSFLWTLAVAAKCFAYKDKGSPEIGMGVATADFPSRRGEGVGLASAGSEFGVEGLHEQGGATVVDVPQGQQQRASAGEKSSADETEEFISGGNHVQARGATAERKKIRRKAHLVELVEVEKTVAKANSGKHGIVRPESSMGGDVNQAAVRSFLKQQAVVRVLADMKLRTGQGCVHGFRFGADERSLFVGNAEHQGTAALIRFSLA